MEDLNPALASRFSKGGASIPARFAEILEAAEGQGLSYTLKRRVVATVLACAALDLEVNAICTLCNETERVKAISRACGINAEPGFCEGDTPETVRSVLESRLSTLCNAFLTSRSQGKLYEFFQGAFHGDPCFNGRMLAIQNFCFEQETGLSADLLTQQEAFSDHDHIAFKFTELMYGLSFEQPPCKSEFEVYLRDQADYDAIYKPWVESPLFPTLYGRARELFG